MKDGKRQVSGVPSKRALIPFMMVHPHDLITSQSPHLLIPSHWRLGFQPLNSAGDTSIQSITQRQNFNIPGLEYQNSSIYIHYIRDPPYKPSLEFLYVKEFRTCLHTSLKALRLSSPSLFPLCFILSCLIPDLVLSVILSSTPPLLLASSLTLQT